MYDWFQNPQTITLSIPLSYKVDTSKIDWMITENYIKINIPEMKLFKFIDLNDSIIPDSSNVVVEDKKIIFYLTKISQNLWDQLEIKSLNKEELKERRKIAEINYNKKVENDREMAANKKNEFGKISLDKSLKIDEEKRKELNDKKSREKNEAEKELYNFISNMKDKPVEKFEKIEESKMEKIVEISKNDVSFPSFLENSNNNETIKFISSSGNLKNENFIFDYSCITNEKPASENQSIRQASNIKVNLTEKIIPHFAARESLSKEPPYPKSKKYVPEKNALGHEIEDRNPIWTKERADNFFRNKDYRSAVNAYNRSLELDPEFHKCYLNRATCLLLLAEFELALADLKKLQNLIDGLEAKEKEDTFYLKIKIKSQIKSYAIHAILNDYSKANQIIDEILENKDLIYILDPKTIEKIKKDKEIIEIRYSTQEIKIEADKLVEEKNNEAAKEIYLSILQHPNEKILANLSLIAINQKDYPTAIKYCTEVLAIIKNFREKINFHYNKKLDNSLEIKILLRRAECYVESKEMTKAQEDIERVERFDITNKDILSKFNEFKEKLKTIVLENYETSANELLKQKKFTEALELYEKSIRLIKKKSNIDQIKFYLNRISCRLALGQFDNVENECTRIIGMILKNKNIATINSNYNLIKQLNDLEFNVYVKRAFVFTKCNKTEEAIKDYNNALLIHPNDSNIKKNLNALKSISIS